MEPQIGQIVLCAFPSQLFDFLVCDGSEQSSGTYEGLSTILNTYTDNYLAFLLPNLTLPSPLSESSGSWQICAIGAYPPYNANSALVGELDLFATGPATYGGTNYYPCNGSILDTPPNPGLYAVIGDQFGGNNNAFSLPTLAAPQGTNLPTGLAYGICASGLWPPGPALASTIGTLQLLPTLASGSGTTWPASYVPCNGQALAIADYLALYSVIGTTFGGGSGTFNVPSVAAPAHMFWAIVANGVMPSFQNEPT
ncbi:MAG TPA: tail fiber protein [Candidatus Baltobacteraceae bacterium]|nr:tail fiber protein [Candidatus Baltobacteraceae bacterium]